jgi:N-hydroxyarylamine O-acetyltransferase
MPNEAFDQKAWLVRIGWDGPLIPTFDGQNWLVAAHAYAIAYESLDITMGRTPRLDLVSLQNKMIGRNRGGYCLEQNMLFRAGLRSIGFDVTSLQGRFVRGLAIDAPRPAIHMVLQVNLPEGPYIVDVGFGNLAPTCALRLELGLEQETPHERMRFVDVGGEPTLKRGSVARGSTFDILSPLRRGIRGRELVHRDAPRRALCGQHHRRATAS